ncbi:hypothetical protein KGP36_04035 [Patescibacteria group bacterium]|nr:hypothetical protein [Patescibacteria group bacterium]
MGWTDFIIPGLETAGGLGLAAAGILGTPFTAGGSIPLIVAGAGMTMGGLQGIASQNAAQTEANAATQAAQTQAGAGKAAINALSTANTNSVNALGTANTNAINAFTGALNRQVGIEQPYLTAGNNALNSLSGMQFNPGNFFESPGYQWSLQQGLKGIQANGAAQGGLMSSSTMQAMGRYAQGLAAQDYSDWFNRAFSRYQANLQPLEAQAGYGAQAAGQLGTALSAYGSGLGSLYRDLGQNLANVYGSYGQNVGNVLTGVGQSTASGQIGVANAQAGGLIGSANALNSGVSNGINSYVSANLLNKLLSQNPTNPQPQQAPSNQSTYIPLGQMGYPTTPIGGPVVSPPPVYDQSPVAPPVPQAQPWLNDYYLTGS